MSYWIGCAILSSRSMDLSINFSHQTFLTLAVRGIFWKEKHNERKNTNKNYFYRHCGFMVLDR